VSAGGPAARIEVRLFAAAREAAGADAVVVEAGASTAGAVLEALSARPDLGAIARRSRLAVNQRFARPEDPVRPEDEVVLIPPVSGG
jgi:molybdopterin converting factor subunit 1